MLIEGIEGPVATNLRSKQQPDSHDGLDTYMEPKRVENVICMLRNNVEMLKKP